MMKKISILYFASFLVMIYFMKKQRSFLLVYLILLLNTSFVFAAPPTRGSLLEPKELSILAVGAGFDQQVRLVRPRRGNAWVPDELEARHTYALLFVDVSPWLTLNLGTGQTESMFASASKYGDAESMWTAGLNVGLWRYDIKDPDWLASRLRLQGAISYWDHESSIIRSGDMAWHECRSSLAISAEYLADDSEQGFFQYPYSITFLAGIANSWLRGNFDAANTDLSESGVDPEMDFMEEKDLGLIGGINLAAAKNLYLCWEVRIFEKRTHSAALVYHF